MANIPEDWQPVQGSFTSATTNEKPNRTESNLMHMMSNLSSSVPTLIASRNLIEQQQPPAGTSLQKDAKEGKVPKIFSSSLPSMNKSLSYSTAHATNKNYFLSSKSPTRTEKG